MSNTLKLLIAMCLVAVGSLLFAVALHMFFLVVIGMVAFGLAFGIAASIK